MRWFFIVLSAIFLHATCWGQTVYKGRSLAFKGGIVEYVAAESDGFSGTTQSPTVTYPAGLANNDVILVGFATFSVHNSTGTPPTGFTKLGEVDSGDSTLSLFWKRSDGTDTSETWTNIFDAGEVGIAVSLAYRGCKTSGSPVNVQTTSTSATSTGKSIGPITTTASNCMVIGWMGTDPDGGTAETCAWDSPATERIDQDTTPTGAEASAGAIYVADYLKAAAGSQSLTATLSGDEETSEFLLALEPQ